MAVTVEHLRLFGNLNPSAIVEEETAARSLVCGSGNTPKLAFSRCAERPSSINSRVGVSRSPLHNGQSGPQAQHRPGAADAFHGSSRSRRARVALVQVRRGHAGSLAKGLQARLCLKERGIAGELAGGPIGRSS